MRTAGTPNLDIQVEMKAQTQDSAEIEDNGTTSGHLVVLLSWLEDKNGLDWRVEDPQYQHEHEKTFWLELE